MTIIATLKPAEGHDAGIAHSIASIPLSRLVPWNGNVRKTRPAENLEELTASIAALGVLQSLVVRKTNRGKYAIIAGRRRFLALSALAEDGAIAADTPVPCRVVSGSADATEISLTENVVRTPMHPADQFEAFRDLTDAGASVADVAARFGISETAVKKRLSLARVSPRVFEAYRSDELTLEQVQAFTVTDDHAAQDQVFEALPPWGGDADAIRDALTQDAIPATDKRVRFIGLDAYEQAGGAVQRDLFAEGETGAFLLDPALLDRLALNKLQAIADATRAEGWKWTQAALSFGYDDRSGFRELRPEPLPLSEDAQAEESKLSQEYNALFDGCDEPDDATSERLDAIEARIAQLNDTARAYTPDVLTMAGAVITLRSDGEVSILRGLVRPEDMPEEQHTTVSRPKAECSAALIESLTEARTAGIGAVLATNPDVALAAVVHAMAGGIFPLCGGENSLQISARPMRLREPSQGAQQLERAHDEWSERLPAGRDALWQWCLAQEQSTLLNLLAYCAARTVSAVQSKHDRPGSGRFTHANALASALSFDLARWFTPTAQNYFLRVPRSSVAAAIAEATGFSAKRSWDKLKKPALAALAEREVAGSGWLPQPLRPAA